MKKLFVFISLILLYQTLPAVEFMPADQLKPGMKGYGMSVFHGWVPERFEVEIIDVIKNATPGPDGDMILAKCSGANLEVSGVIAGMSGSPVYIDGKLIGAVSSTWAYSKQPIAGITPIIRMLEQKDLHDPNYFDANGSLKKIATPIVMSGVTGDAQKIASEFFKEHGFLLCDGMSGGVSKPDNPDLQAGDSVAINLVDGDLSIAAIGTVTYVEGKDVYIFGHPFEQFGNLKLPVSKSYVYTVIPSIGLSFKLGAGSDPTGSTVFDGDAAVYCQKGVSPEMIPLKVNIVTPTASAQYSFRIADEPSYFAMLATVALSSSMTRLAGVMDNKSINYDFKIRMTIDGKERILTNSYSYSIDPAYFSFMYMLMDLRYYFSIFMNTDFAKIKIIDAEVNIRIEKGIHYSVLSDAFSDKPGYYPGETANIQVIYREYLSGTKYCSIPVKIPKNVTPGKYKIYIANEAGTYFQVMKLFPEISWFQSLDDIFYNSTLFLDNTKLQAVFIDVKNGLQLSDKKLGNLPGTYISLLNIKNLGDRFFYFPQLSQGELQFKSPMFGFLQVQVNVYDTKTPKKAE
ncbi:MAG: hypothetical protein A2Y33_01435 [Spirochaetes bacterium GWF1_51_8]|nr:MAG: hypothetical protein A2Y33_01435 [Spirochaetes bacterium GWF1_51_8]